MARPQPSGIRTTSVTGRLRDTAGGDAAAPFEAIGSGLAAGAGAAGAAAGGALLLRRLAGGFSTGDGGLAWMAAAAGIAVVAVVDAAAGRTGGLGRLAARVGLAAGVAAVAIPPRPGDWAAIAAVALAAAVAVLPPPRPRAAGRAAGVRRVRHGPGDAPRRQSATRRSATPGRLVQWLERYETPAGDDCLRGRVCLAVAAGSRGTHAHVGFCPAFAATPLVEVSTEYDGVEAVVSAAEVLPWGIRVECRLSEPADEPLEIPVDVSVRTA